MKDYFSDIFARMDLKQVREFLLYATAETDEEDLPYGERIKQGGDPIYNRIENLYADNTTERDKAASDLSQALAAHDAVYMEIGMKAGARLIYQLLLCDEHIIQNKAGG
jgi:hypothetical protein